MTYTLEEALIKLRDKYVRQGNIYYDLHDWSRADLWYHRSKGVEDALGQYYQRKEPMKEK